jgi:hypothetical protein
LIIAPVTIGDRSCTDDFSCSRLGFRDDAVTIGDESCTGFRSCELFRGLEGDCDSLIFCSGSSFGSGSGQLQCCGSEDLATVGSGFCTKNCECSNSEACNCPG